MAAPAPLGLGGTVLSRRQTPPGGSARLAAPSPLQPTPAAAPGDKHREPGTGGAESRYELLEQLGEGSYGSVHKARDTATGELVAVKIIPLNAQEEEGFAEIQREVHVLQECNHPNVVRYLGSLRTRDALWIVMEYCGGGSAADLIHAGDAPLDEQSIAYICAETLKGLSYLHSIGKVHRDVKCGNVLLTHSGEVKLADFGVAARLTATMSKRNTFIGTPHWMAPEVIQESRYDGKVDVWSLGISAIEMGELHPPRWAVHPMRVIFMISRDPPPHLSDKDKWSLPMHDFIAQCLQKDARPRPTARQLLQHKLILNAPQRPPSTVLSMMQRAQEWLSARAATEASQAAGTGHSDSGFVGATRLAGAMSAASSVLDSGTFVQHPAERTPSGAAADSGTFVQHGAAAGTSGSGASGTFVQHAGASGTTAFNPSGTVAAASGTFVANGTVVSPAAGTGRVGDTAAVSGAPADSGSDYMAALRAAGTSSRAGSPRSPLGAAPESKAALAHRSETERLKSRLRAMYEGGDVIPLPLLRAAHAAPLALLNPIAAPHQPPGGAPRSLGQWQEGDRRAVEVLCALAGEGLQPSAGGGEGAVAGAQEAGAHQAATGRAQLPPALAKRISTTPVLLNLARTLAYHKQCLQDTILPPAEEEELKAVVNNLNDTLRTILCL